jgi:FtsK/SpoIIIE family
MRAGGMVRGRRRPLEWEAEVVETFALVWRCRLELALLAAGVGMQRLLARLLSEAAAIVAVGLIVALVVAIRPARRGLWRALRRAWVARGWARAATDTGLADGPFRVPRVLGVESVQAGDVLRVRVLRGQSVLALDARREELAACLRVREVRIEREREAAADARVTLVRRDPFEDAAPIPWPKVDAGSLSLWDPIPVGVDEQGEFVGMRLVERNVLVGGEPGAGKSVALSLLVAAGALDPDARVWLLDGKLVELAAWAPVAERIVGPDVEQAIETLRALQREMDARYRELLALGLRKVRREDRLPLHLIVVDELAFYLSAPDKKLRMEFADLLRDLVARGRAAGVIVVAATQKPGADVVPSALRDLFGFRLALRCNTPQASDTILGQGWASSGFDASTVPGGQRGVGLLLAEEERPERIKTFHLSDGEIGAIGERATAHRADEWLAGEGAQR